MRTVFEDFSVDIEPNHITGIIGRNGQGKTTLMNLIAGKFEPDEGIIEIDGKNPQRLSGAKREEPSKRALTSNKYLLLKA